MPRTRPLKVDKEKQFGAKLKSEIISAQMECREVAQLIGITPRTMSNRFLNPANMTLGQLKDFIKVTGMGVEPVINYLLGK